MTTKTAIKLCKKGLHAMLEGNFTSDGRCKQCRADSKAVYNGAKKQDRRATGPVTFEAKVADTAIPFDDEGRERLRQQIIARCPAAREAIAQREYEAALDSVPDIDGCSITLREILSAEVVCAS
jgi:hypothetical protein